MKNWSEPTSLLKNIDYENSKYDLVISKGNSVLKKLGSLPLEIIF